VDERADTVRRRFENMLIDARAAIRSATPDPSGPGSRETSWLAAAKALNRAGGFLEAVAITFPDLGLELIVRFEEFAQEVEKIYGMPAGPWVPRTTGDRRSRTERRQPGHQRPGDGPRPETERRIADRRLVADRRFGTKAGG
jgi:hypothetical protein